jgi:hypothetical protein
MKQGGAEKKTLTGYAGRWAERRNQNRRGACGRLPIGAAFPLLARPSWGETSLGLRLRQTLLFSLLHHLD